MYMHREREREGGRLLRAGGAPRLLLVPLVLITTSSILVILVH